MANKKGLCFWEAMKALEEGKIVKSVHWDLGESIYLVDDYLYDKGSKTPIKNRDQHTIFEHINEEWEIVEEPELYWQWINIEGDILNKLLKGRKGKEEFVSEFKGKLMTFKRFAGPWIKTEEGFRKHADWKQF